MTFGEAGRLAVRVTDLKDVEAILEVFVKHGHTEVSPTFLSYRRQFI